MALFISDYIVVVLLARSSPFHARPSPDRLLWPHAWMPRFLPMWNNFTHVRFIADMHAYMGAINRSCVVLRGLRLLSGLCALVVQFTIRNCSLYTAKAMCLH